MEVKTTKLSSSEQAANGRLYSMNMKFTGNVSLKSMNDFLDSMGVKEQPVLPHAITLNMSQIVPFIPDEDMIAEYEKVIEQSYNENNDKVVIREVHFDGYEYVYAVKQTILSDERFDKLKQKILAGGYGRVCDFLKMTPDGLTEEDYEDVILKRFQEMTPAEYKECLKHYGIE